MRNRKVRSDRSEHYAGKSFFKSVGQPERIGHWHRLANTRFYAYLDSNFVHASLPLRQNSIAQRNERFAAYQCSYLQRVGS